MGDYKHAHGYDNMTDEQLLKKVTKGWRSNETKCGSGSEVKNAQRVIKALKTIATKYGILTISDAGAGDLNWVKTTDLGLGYFGYDLYPRHPEVVQFDITKEVLPKSGLILCRHVLNHLSIQFAERALQNFEKSGSKYLLITNCDNQRDYWKEYGLSVNGKLIQTFKDCQHWELELYEIN